MKKAALSDLKRTLVWESLLALARYRKTGEAPTDANAPNLMAIWRTARKRLTTVGLDHAVCVVVHRGMRFHVSSIYGQDGRLHRFFLRDYFSGALVLTGDDDGPVFCPDNHDAIGASSPRNQAVSFDGDTNSSLGKES